MCDKWPKLTADGHAIRIMLPGNRPYVKEIINYMESKDYILNGSRTVDWPIPIKELCFIQSSI